MLGDGHGGDSAVGDPGVNFVAQDHQLLLAGEIGQRLHLIRRQHSASRVVRTIEDKDFGIAPFFLGRWTVIGVIANVTLLAIWHIASLIIVYFYPEGFVPSKAQIIKAIGSYEKVGKRESALFGLPSLNEYIKQIPESIVEEIDNDKLLVVWKRLNRK